MVDEAIAALPQSWRAGHCRGDDQTLVRRRLLVRADTAGGTRKMLTGLSERNVVFSVGTHTSAEAVTGIQAIEENSWQPAVDVDGQPRPGAQVTEAAHLLTTTLPKDRG